MPKLISYLTLLCTLLTPLATANTSATNILFLAGKRSHAVGQHEHRAGCILLAEALKQSGLNINAKVVNVWPENPSDFENVDAIIVYADAGGKYDEEQYALLDEKVKAGTGIMFIHYGVHPKPDIGKKHFTPWTGGFFETGFSVNPFWTADLTPKSGHPISNGIDSPVVANDEFYLNMRFAEEKCCGDHFGLVEAKFEEDRVTRYNNLWNEYGDNRFGESVKLMWCRDSQDQGRGVGFTGGHYHHNWANDGFRKLVLNAIVWAARGDVPESGVTSAPVSNQQLNENLDGVPEIPLKHVSIEELKSLKPMLRPLDPANYNQKEHYKWVEKSNATPNQ